MFARRKATRRLGIIFFCVLALVALVQGREAAGGTVLKLAHAHTPTESILGLSATLFADNVQEVYEWKRGDSGLPFGTTRFQ